MTGKELILVLGGAAALGGGAAVTSSLLQGDQVAPATQFDTSELDARMASLDKTQARTAKALERLGDKLDRLSESVSMNQMETAKLHQEMQEQKAAATQGSIQGRNFPDVIAKRSGESGAVTGLDWNSDDPDIADKLAKMKQFDRLPAGIAEGLGEELGKALQNIEVDFGGGASPISGMLKGMQLRQLPEAERWQKAQDDLGLTYGQVEDLKAATSDYDTAMEGAMVTEERDLGNGGKFTLKRTDQEKSRAARDAYTERVNNTLDADQQKKWRNDGYGNAFGKHGAGNAVAITSVNTMSFGSGTKKTNEEQE